MGAAAPISTVGSFIAVRIPQSISLGGRSRIPHQKWCNKRFGEENPPVLGKSWSSHSSSFGCGARLHLPASFCTIPHTRVGSLLALPTPHPYAPHPTPPPPTPTPPTPAAAFAREASSQHFAQGQECRKPREWRSRGTKGAEHQSWGQAHWGAPTSREPRHGRPHCSWTRGFLCGKGN